MVRKRNEKDELTALRRHFTEAYPDSPAPRTIEFAECDLTKREKEALKALNDMMAQIESVMPEVMKEMKEKGFEVPNEGQKLLKKHVGLGVF